MDINILREIATIACFGTFIGIMVWAFKKGNRERFERDAQIPFQQD